MHPSLIPPRHVAIDTAASFAATTVDAIRHYHEIGLLPEPERSADEARRYGYRDMIRLLWIRAMADTGTSEDGIRGLLADFDRAGGGLATRMGALSELVASRFTTLPEGTLRSTDLDTLLVMQRIFGPLGAAIHATRYIALATHPDLRAQSDRVDAAEAALDDTVSADDPRVADAAAQRYAFEQALEAVIDESGIEQGDEELFEPWGELPAGVDDQDDNSIGVFEAVAMMPYDFSPARLRSVQLTEQLATGSVS